MPQQLLAASVQGFGAVVLPIPLLQAALHPLTSIVLACPAWRQPCAVTPSSHSHCTCVCAVTRCCCHQWQAEEEVLIVLALRKKSADRTLDSVMQWWLACTEKRQRCDRIFHILQSQLLSTARSAGHVGLWADAEQSVEHMHPQDDVGA